jgi:CrcB protein
LQEFFIFFTSEIMIRSYAVVFLGGGVGAVARYWLSGAVYRWLPPDFPYGNLVVNVAGCFLIGFLMTSADDRFIMSPILRTFLAIGVLGGFTTFSSFSYETLSLFRNQETLLGMANVLFTIVGCLGATYLGSVVGKLV